MRKLSLLPNHWGLSTILHTSYKIGLKLWPSSFPKHNKKIFSICLTVVFEASSEYGSWHAPCLVVGGHEEKWIITFFKSPPTRFTGMMLGLY